MRHLLTAILGLTAAVSAFGYTAFPEKGATVSSLPEFTVDFGEGNTVEWNFTDKPFPGLITLYNSSTPTGVAVNAYIGQNSTFEVRDGHILVFKPFNEGLYPGTYTFQLQKSWYKVNGEPGTETMTRYTVKVANDLFETAEDFNVTLDPPAGSEQCNFKALTVTPAENMTFQQPSGLLYSWNSAEEAASKDASRFGDTMMLGLTTFSDKQINFVNENALVPPDGQAKATAYFYISPGTFAINGVFNKGINLEYVVVNPAFSFTSTPADGGKTFKISPITLTFPNLTSDMTLSLGADAKGTLMTSRDVEVEGAVFTLTAEGNTVTALLKEPGEGATEDEIAEYNAMLSKTGNYKFVLSPGSIVINGMESPEFTVNFEVASYLTYPDKGVTVSSLGEFVIDFGEGNVPEWNFQELPYPGLISIYNSQTGANYYIGKESEYEVRGSSLVIKPCNGGLFPGTYTFQLQKKWYKLNGEEGPYAITRYIVKVDESLLDNTVKYTYTLEPEPDTVTTELQTITLVLPENVVFANPWQKNVMYSFESAEAAQGADAIWFADSWFAGLTYSEDNKIILTKEKALTLPEGETSQKVYIYVAPGTFAIDGVLNSGFNLEYTLRDVFYFETAPAEGGKVEKLNEVTVTFPNVTEAMTLEVAENAKASMTLIGGTDPNLDYTLTAEGNVVKFEITAPAEDATEEEKAAWNEKVSHKGTYNLIIPAGTIYINGEAAPEVRVNFEVANDIESSVVQIAAESAAVEYYDLSGRRLKEAPAKGLYIEVKVAADGSRTASKGVR